MAFVVWLAVLVLGRGAPARFTAFVAAYLRYTVHLSALPLPRRRPVPAASRGEPALSDRPRDRRARAAAEAWRAPFRLVLALPALRPRLDPRRLVPRSAARSGARRSSAGARRPRARSSPSSAGSPRSRRGAMPRGLRDAAVYAIGYGAQVDRVRAPRSPTAIPTPPGPSCRGRSCLPHPVALAVADDLGRPRLIVALPSCCSRPAPVLAHRSGRSWPRSRPSRRGSPRSCSAASRARSTASSPRSCGTSTHVSAFLYVVGRPFPGFVGARAATRSTSRSRRPSASDDSGCSSAPRSRSRRFSSPRRTAACCSSSALLGWFAALVTGRMPRGPPRPRRRVRSATRRRSSHTCCSRPRYPDSSPALGGQCVGGARDGPEAALVDGDARRRCCAALAVGWLALRVAPPGQRRPGDLDLPRVDVDAVFGDDLVDARGALRAVLLRQLGARAGRALRDARGLCAPRRPLRARVGRRADRHGDAARHARPRRSSGSSSCRSRSRRSGGSGGTACRRSATSSGSSAAGSSSARRSSRSPGAPRRDGPRAVARRLVVAAGRGRARRDRGRCSSSPARTSTTDLEPPDDPRLVAAYERFERAQGVEEIPLRVEEVSGDTSQANAYAFGIGPSRADRALGHAARRAVLRRRSRRRPRARARPPLERPHREGARVVRALRAARGAGS